MSHMEREQALALWTELSDQKLPAHLSYRHHENMMPSDNYAVSVQVGPGHFDNVKLKSVMEIAEAHGCQVHLIGDGLRLLP